MKKILSIFIFPVLLVFMFGCASVSITPDQAKSWTKTDWEAANDSEKKAALEAIISIDGDDINASESAKISIDEFNYFFNTLKNEELTLGEIFDSCIVEEIK